MSLWPPKTWDRSTRVIVVGVAVGALMLTGVFGRAFWYKYARESMVRQLRERHVNVEPRYSGRSQATTLQAGLTTPHSYTITLTNAASDEELAEVMALVSELPAPITLNISNSPHITELPHVDEGSRVIQLFITDNKSLRDIDAIAGMPQLSSIQVINCPLETDWNFLESLPQLSTIHLEDCGRITSSEPFKKLRSLRSLNIDTETTFENLDFLGSLPQLVDFVIGDSTKAKDHPDRILARLNDINGLARCPTLHRVELYCCDIDATVPPLDKLYSLQHLELPGVKQQTSLDFLRAGHFYEVVRLTDWPELTDITRLASCQVQQNLDLSGASKLTDISPLLEDEMTFRTFRAGISLRRTAVPREQIEQLRTNYQGVVIQSDYPTTQ